MEMNQVLFVSNDGRSKIVSSVDEIRDFMGEILGHFSSLEIVDSYVIANIKGQYVSIGRIELISHEGRN